MCCESCYSNSMSPSPNTHTNMFSHTFLFMNTDVSEDQIHVLFCLCVSLFFLCGLLSALGTDVSMFFHMQLLRSTDSEYPWCFRMCVLLTRFYFGSTFLCSFYMFGFGFSFINSNLAELTEHVQ